MKTWGRGLEGRRGAGLGQQGNWPGGTEPSEAKKGGKDSTAHLQPGLWKAFCSCPLLTQLLCS